MKKVNKAFKLNDLANAQIQQAEVLPSEES